VVPFSLLWLTWVLQQQKQQQKEEQIILANLFGEIPS